MQLRRLPTRFGGASRLPSFKRWRAVTAPPPPPPPPASWDIVPAPVFVQGAVQTYDVAATGPLDLGYLPGGMYDSASGQPLPAGLSLSAAGMITDGGAAVASVSGVVFGYTEPGGLPVLTLNSGNVSGTLPYMATAYPLEGVVPTGKTLVSAEDSSLRATTLSTWEDGSAKVMVLAGHKTGILANSTATVTLRPGVLSDTPLTAAYIATKLTSITTSFAGNNATFSTFGSPDRVWWANSQVICAQYHLDLGLGVMQAIIVVHAFAGGRCFVEVMVENGRIDANAANPNSPLITTQTYTGATIAVTPSGGGAATIATVSSPTTGMVQPNSRSFGTYVGGHERGRAWYCNAWVNGTTVSAELGTADPQVDVTHDVASLQAHPWFFKPFVASTQNMATKYGQTYDTYVPWSTGRLRMPNMQGGGDHDEIALFTGTQSDYIQSGHKLTRKAVIATGLAVASAGFHFRHIDGTVPLPSRAKLYGSKSNWPGGPNWPECATSPSYAYGDTTGTESGDAAHSPAIALIPFLCRPSPVFIEQVWKEQNLYCSGVGHNTTNGAQNYAQSRGRYWKHRNLGSAIFLTPDSTLSGVAQDATRKSDLRETLFREIQYIQTILAKPWNTIHLFASSKDVFDLDYSTVFDGEDHEPDPQAGPVIGIQISFFMQSFGAMTLHAVNSAKVLTGSDQTTHTAVVDMFIKGAFVDWIQAAPDGDYSWRCLPYHPTVGYVGTDHSTLDQFSDSFWHLNQFHPAYSGNRPTAPGPFIFQRGGPDDGNDVTWNIWDSLATQIEVNTGASLYGLQFLCGLLCGVERDLPGADAAWTKVYGTSGNGGITNFNTWMATTGAMPQWNHKPRNK